MDVIEGLGLGRIMEGGFHRGGRGRGRLVEGGWKWWGGDLCVLVPSPPNVSVYSTWRWIISVPKRHF